MGIRFIGNVQGNERGYIQQFIENEIDRDNDVYTCAISEEPGNYVYVRRGWHPTREDPHEHLTVDVYFVCAISSVIVVW
jgi:hypothetical protein